MQKSRGTLRRRGFYRRKLERGSNYCSVAALPRERSDACVRERGHAVEFGGRSFGFSGMHFHDNWKRDDYRRLVAQGVLWTVKLPVPEKGLVVDLADADFLLTPKKK